MIRFQFAIICLASVFVVVRALPADESQVAHMVFFTLAEDSPEHREQLVAACDKYLGDHEGTVYYSAGPIADDLRRDVNDREFQVALHIVFATKADHDRYQTHARHLKFIDENKKLWSNVRVFDSYVAARLPSPLELVLAQEISLAFDRMSLERALQELQSKITSKEAVTIELDVQSLKYEGITRNIPIQKLSITEKSVAVALTEIVVRANPIRGVQPSDPQQMLVWVADGMTVRITTRRNAEKQNLTLPAVFTAAPK